MAKDRTAQFLAQMGKGASVETEPEAAPPALPPVSTAVVHEIPRAQKPARKAKTITRADLKHFGGYLDDDTLEKIALLRIRLKMDNSALIKHVKHAIEELHRKHNAKRAFGDA
jgi:hypothetical protein